jgi:CheY-like chemotaxis protein
LTVIISRILLIDDDEDDQDIFVTAVAEMSNTVVCKVESSARQALEKLTDGELSAELIFLDLNMPIMDGRQFLAAIKQHETLKEIRVIVLSTSANTDAVREAKALGAEEFFTKPSNYQDLKSILQSILK